MAIPGDAVSQVLDNSPLPARRVILLGASNLIRGLASVLTAAGQFWGGPLDVLAALGHGRSYGVESRVFARGLPGIRHCGLWNAWHQREPLPTSALVTDIGNDLLYEIPTTQIASWVDECVSRLAARCEQITITELPLDSLLSMSAARFYLLRSLIFPNSKLTYERARNNAQELNQQIVPLAARYGARLVKPRATWYGFDPIHIRLTHARSAWREILIAEEELATQVTAEWTLRERLALRMLRPEQRRLFGVIQRCPQPAQVLSNGTRISLY